MISDTSGPVRRSGTGFQVTPRAGPFPAGSGSTRSARGRRAPRAAAPGGAPGNRYRDPIRCAAEKPARTVVAVTATQASSTPVGPVVALVFAAGAACAFSASDAIGFLDPLAEVLPAGAWVLGWALLCWAGLVGGASAVSHVRGAVAREPVSRSGVVLLGVTLAIVALLVWAHPLWGSGSGSAG